MTDGQATPAAARDIEITNNLIYTISLQPNLKWHDGKKLTSSDVNLKIRGAEVSFTDNYTLLIELKEPYSPLSVILSKPLFREHLIGLGHYKVVKAVYRNDNKISELTILPFDRNLPTLTYKFYPNKDDAVLAFKLGEIDMLDDIDSSQVFTGWSNLKIEEKTQYNKVVALFYNFKDSRFKDKEIRQALAYAIPPIENYDKAVSPISPLSWAYSQRLRLYNYDTESALKILSKSPLSSESAELILTTPSSLLNIGQFIADAWNSVGVNAKVKVDSTIPSDYQVMIKIVSIPPDPDQYVLWQSTQENTNLSNYVSPKIDKLLEDGRKIHNLEERKKIYADFQFYLVDDAPAIFLYYPKLMTISRS